MEDRIYASKPKMASNLSQENEWLKHVGKKSAVNFGQTSFELLEG
jgi:hypothetical protein